MDEKEVKEVQGTLHNGNAHHAEKVSDDEFNSVLKSISPGTNLRAALDGSLKLGRGALIVVENEHVLPIIDGGFKVNCKFTPQKLVELTKMDGAIIISKDYKRINFANVLLTPDSKIKTSETGTRHKAAERTARQTGTMVLAISERKNEIHLYFKNIRYPVRSTDEILRKANSYIQLMEKQRESFDSHLTKLNSSELHNYPSLHQAVQVLQKGKIIMKIAQDLKKYIVELGSESTLLKMRLKEIAAGVEEEVDLILKDYTNLDAKKSKYLMEELSYDEILEKEKILSVLAHETESSSFPIKGWRMLSKTSLSEAEIAKILKDKNSLGETIYASPRAFVSLIGEERSKLFKEEIERIKLNAGSL